MRYLTATVALLALAVSGCNRPPAPQAASHPPALDLTCPAEPGALTDEQVGDEARLPDGRTQGQANEEAWNDTALVAGRACRDALGRACRWHVERGMTEVVCPPAPGRRTSWLSPDRPARLASG